MEKCKVNVDIQMVETRKLKPNQYNPNIMTDEQFKSIVQDFKENGFVGQPIIVDKKYEIIDGEHRWRCAKYLNFKKVPIVMFDPKDDDHKKMLTIGWNSKRGEFSPTKLAQIVQDLNQRYTLEELSGRLGFNMERLRDSLAMPQVTSKFIEQIRNDAKQREQEIPSVMNFAISKEQERIVIEALEASIGKNKGDKLYHICTAYLKGKRKNE